MIFVTFASTEVVTLIEYFFLLMKMETFVEVHEKPIQINELIPTANHREKIKLSTMDLRELYNVTHVDLNSN